MDQIKTITLNKPHLIAISMYVSDQKINLKHTFLHSSPHSHTSIFNLTCALFLLSCILSRCTDLLLLALLGPSKHLSKSCCLDTLEVSSGLEPSCKWCLFLFLRPSLVTSGLCCSGPSLALGSEGSWTLGLLKRLWRDSNTSVHTTYMLALTKRVTNRSNNTFSQRKRWSIL